MDQQNETVTISKAEYEKLLISAVEYENLLASQENMQSQIDWLTERVRLLTKQKFGASSEKIVREELQGQISMIFNEAELTADTEVKPEEETVTVKGYTKRHRSGSVDDVIPEGTPVEKVEHRLSEEEQQNCNNGYNKYLAKTHTEWEYRSGIHV